MDMCDKADVTNKILGNLPNRIRSPGNPGFSDCLSGIEKRFATHQQIDGRGIGKQGEFADAKQNSFVKKQGVMHFFPIFLEMSLQTASLANECGGSSELLLVEWTESIQFNE